MSEKIKKTVSFIIFELISAWVITGSVIPGFNNIGHLFYQISVTAFLIWIFLLISDGKKITPVTVSHSLIIMSVYWVLRALIKQIELHIEKGDKSLTWHFLFYYDRPAMLIVAFSAAALFFAVRLLMKSDDETFVAQYRRFQKNTLISFSLYYLLVMFYSLFLIRGIGNGDSTLNAVNLIPFNVFKGMKAANYEYELIFLFIGNIAIFVPLGVLVSAFFKKRFLPLQIAFPFILSIGIEVSQYLLKNGQPDIDDVILNVIGYFIGFLIKKLLDKLVFRFSKGKFSSVFII